MDPFTWSNLLSEHLVKRFNGRGGTDFNTCQISVVRSVIKCLTFFDRGGVGLVTGGEEGIFFLLVEAEARGHLFLDFHHDSRPIRTLEVLGRE